MTFVIKHALRASAGMYGGYRPEGWSPRLKVTIVGPSPAGAELVWTVRKPGGGDWFEHHASAPELTAGEMTTIDLQRFEDGIDIDEAGSAPFTLRVVSELDGVDELLHDGSLRAVALDGEHRYAVDSDWTLTTGLLCLDAVDQSDAPKLKVTAFLKTQVDSYGVEAHCFYNGRRFAQASYVSSEYAFTANDAAPVTQELVAEFDTVRGWNNLTAEGWGEDDWHLLDANDGEYEVKFVRDKKITRVVPFRVDGGRVVASGSIEFDRWTAPMMITGARVEGDQDGEWDASSTPFYGDPATAALAASIDDVYADRR